METIQLSENNLIILVNLRKFDYEEQKTMFPLYSQIKLIPYKTKQDFKLNLSR